jgi:hypothetical protein
LGHGAASKVSSWLSGKDGGKDGVEMRGVGGFEKKTMTGINNTIFSAAGVVSCSLNSLLFSCGFFTVKQLASSMATAGGGVGAVGNVRCEWAAISRFRILFLLVLALGAQSCFL